ncbi:MAG TPA: monovalent cation/H(+) antiporter subunit G [Anaerolineae bacterium]|nr:monovalent cation/H(+) antiporter subunit G [Anaerolineae bacterium]HOQ98549.1 monovalent cation/H(+) antiporter subunit G [Anaerolineae bacterium]HPL27043.1 monovalent cation/H(+) antiporter subunit G [Anaerolineae bacterium]
MSTVRDVLASALLLGGVFFSLVAAIGIVRLPDVYSRIHASSKSTTLGLAGILLAVLLHFGTYEVTTKVLLVILFTFLTAPVGAHMIARSAYVCAVSWYAKTTRYDLERATVVCATRGGPASERVHERAIELAQERQGVLVFLHVVDTAELSALGPAHASAVTREMRTLAQAILRTAQAQARAAGVQARAELREGEVSRTLQAFVHEVGADVLVVGYPHTAPGNEHEAEGRLWRLLGGLQEQGNVRLVVAR